MAMTRPAQGGMAVAALFWTCLYAFAVAAAAFAGERETRTLGLLDALPVERWRLWLAKSSFALASTLALGLVLFAAACAGHRSLADRHARARRAHGRTRAAHGAGLGTSLVGGHQQCTCWPRCWRSARHSWSCPAADTAWNLQPRSIRKMRMPLNLAIAVRRIAGLGLRVHPIGPPSSADARTAVLGRLAPRADSITGRDRMR